jgi:hypothetical protein
MATIGSVDSNNINNTLMCHTPAAAAAPMKLLSLRAAEL